VGLDVGKFCTEELLGPFYGDRLDGVDFLTAAVVAVTGVSLRAYLFVRTVPAAIKTASLTKFSEAISSIFLR
jgi:hypothetical protein